MTGERPRRVLVICKGNICRSPTAAAMLAARLGDRAEVRSAGTHGRYAGEPAHPLMIAVRRYPADRAG
ncbi:low molecular weight phosphatase family protein [Kitasatospora sp. NPDC052896]|uniref:low molecular weight phosphatase family protein n=1 Tax=Kitasatospora sp. NPDC052896 TaxID=3364061 RepID=UPI0037C8F31A